MLKMNSDLWWLANNEPVWNEKHDRICIFSAGGTEFFNSKYFPGKEGFTKEEHKSARRRLGLDHPEIFPASTPEEDEAWAEAERRMDAIAQNGNDGDHYGPYEPGGVCVFHGVRHAAYEPCPMCVLADKAAKEEGKQPAYDPDDVAFVRAESSIAERYPQYYKDVRHLEAVDVYQVHQLFGIDDCSGCIQHASKKLLLSGARTGGKPKRKDVEEARDTLTRWLQMEKSQ